MLRFEKYRSQLTGWKEMIFTDKFGYILASECEKINIDPWFVIAIIEGESNFNELAMDKDKTHFGLMQISAVYHYDRMLKTGGRDLYDPIDNLRTGINLIEEIVGDIDKDTMEYINTVNPEYGLYVYTFMKFCLGDVTDRMFYNNNIPSFVNKVIERFKELRTEYGIDSRVS